MTSGEGSAILLVDPRGRILLQQRDDHRPPAGYGRWAVPGGGREGDESPRQTALREFEEETGVRLQRLRFYRTLLAGRHPLEPPIDRIDVFFADDVIPEDRIVVGEGLDFRYWAPDDFAALPMNPPTRALLDDFLASDRYRGLLALKAEGPKVGVSVLELDRWGRVLLQLRDADLPEELWPDTWWLPGGLVEPGEPPDLAAFREFEEETGFLLDDLHLYRVFSKAELPHALVDSWHVYYIDADLDEDMIDVNEGQAFRYFAPGEIAHLPMPEPARELLERFFLSPAYKALFH